MQCHCGSISRSRAPLDAGAIAGAYFISRQTNGTAVYHDVLPEAGLRFMDKSKLAAALGLCYFYAYY
jgi:hypothetical protein